jgi:hypothetical protein
MIKVLSHRRKNEQVLCYPFRVKLPDLENAA